MAPVCPSILFSEEIPEPCYALDEERLAENAAILEKTQRESGAKILLALKAFSAWSAFPILSRAYAGPLYGCCASSLDEARLGKEKFGGEIHAFAAAWDDKEFRELTKFCDKITFNSFAQWRKFKPVVAAANRGRKTPIICGLRVNPEHSEGAPAIYDPCAPGSRLGVRSGNMESLDGLTGLHIHTLCEQNADALERTLAVFEKKFNPYVKRCSWLNWGGGHHITREDYDVNLLVELIKTWRKRYGVDVYLEPGEAVALDAGWLTCRVLDVVEADMPIAILDVSAACHMPDVLETPYTPGVWYPGGDGKPGKAGVGEGVHKYRLAGKSCLAGDVIGEYGFSRPLKIDDRLVFDDMAIYSMVKNNTFNGLRLPAIGSLKTRSGPFKLIREFGYEDFRNRLS